MFRLRSSTECRHYLKREDHSIGRVAYFGTGKRTGGESRESEGHEMLVLLSAESRGGKNRKCGLAGKERRGLRRRRPYVKDHLSWDEKSWTGKNLS